MKVVVSKSELNKFKRRALKAYPCEHLEALWGKQVNQDEFHIFVFAPIEHEANRKSLMYDEFELELSAQDAEEVKLTLLGTIHSHPDCVDAAPSECDYDDSVKNGELISGVALIIKHKLSGRRHFRVRFWGPLQSVDPEFT